LKAWTFGIWYERRDWVGKYSREMSGRNDEFASGDIAARNQVLDRIGVSVQKQGRRCSGMYDFSVDRVAADSLLP
jgi:hypothetical protein